jgi:hypothetical protein
MDGARDTARQIHGKDILIWYEDLISEVASDILHYIHYPIHSYSQMITDNGRNLNIALTFLNWSTRVTKYGE